MSLSDGAIAGIVVVVTLAVVLLGVFIYFRVRGNVNPGKVPPPWAGQLGGSTSRLDRKSSTSSIRFVGQGLEPTGRAVWRGGAQVWTQN